MHGLDDVARTLKREERIAAYEATDGAALRHNRAGRLTRGVTVAVQWELRAIGWSSSAAASAGCSRSAG